MKQIYSGKTKDVFKLSDGNFRLFFKDDVTGKDGKFDPGANEVGLAIADNGYYGLIMSSFFFEQLEQSGIRTHFISADLSARTMDVKPVSFFGQGIEVISRYIATGSFIRRYGAYRESGSALDCFTEISLKDDERGDPFISKELLEEFKILENGDYETLIALTREISELIRDKLKEFGLTLYDLKLEFGKDSEGKILLIDEVSGGNMRVYEGEKALTPIEISKILTKK